MIYNRSYYNPTLKELLQRGLRSGDTLYSFVAGMVAEAKYVGMEQGYAVIRFGNDHEFRATLSDQRWNTSKDLLMISTRNRLLNHIRDYEYDLRAVEKELRKKQIYFDEFK